MGTGYLPDDVLSNLMNELVNVPGDFAEVGVFRGALFKRLVAVAHVLKRTVHGFDSFVGMNEPTAHDQGRYQKGELSVGGVEAFRNIINQSVAQHRQLSLRSNVGAMSNEIREDRYQLWEGYVPDCLTKCPVQQFAFIYLDLDHHDPTEQALEWAWPRLAPGGILGFDDYFPGRDRLASPPIDRFLEKELGQLRLVQFSNNQLFIRKRNEAGERRSVA